MDTTKPTEKQIKEQAVDYIEYLKNEHRLPVLSAYLFGSHARGTSHGWSDIDLCIVSPQFKHEDALIYLWRRLRKQDIQNLVEPVGFTPEEFNAKIPSPLVAEIRKYGEEIPVQ